MDSQPFGVNRYESAFSLSEETCQRQEHGVLSEIAGQSVARMPYKGDCYRGLTGIHGGQNNTSD
jgi:hypothetical protein